MHRLLPTVAWVLSLVGTGGCASLDVADYAARHDMSLRLVEGNGFYHLAIERAGSSRGSRLHVYIEGDGIPWVGNLPSADPTPKDTLVLRLANLDDNDVAYLGRPCYFQPIDEAGRCHPGYWTSHRYSEGVVRSMAAAIGRLRQPRHDRVVLIGHSGGGVLAALLASRVTDVAGVITVAANLDVDAWAAHHDYDPLVGSLDPMKERRQTAIPHLQYVGSNDAVVPAEISAAYARDQPGVESIRIDGFSHACCWERIWPDILETAAERFAD